MPKEFKIIASWEDRSWNYWAMSALLKKNQLPVQSLLPCASSTSWVVLPCGASWTLHQLSWMQPKENGRGLFFFSLEMTASSAGAHVGSSMAAEIWSQTRCWHFCWFLSGLIEAGCLQGRFLFIYLYFFFSGVMAPVRLSFLFSWNPTKRGQPRQTLISLAGGGPLFSASFLQIPQWREIPNTHSFLKKKPKGGGAAALNPYKSTRFYCGTKQPLVSRIQSTIYRCS